VSQSWPWASSVFSLLDLSGPRVTRYAADATDSGYVCIGESGRADRRGGTQRWLFSSMRSRPRGTPSRGGICVPGTASGPRVTDDTRTGPETLSQGGGVAVGRARGWWCRTHSRSCRPAERARERRRTLRRLEGDAETASHQGAPSPEADCEAV